MSRCNDIDAHMMDWLYDELEPADRARFDEHAQGCARCRDELASLAHVREIFRDLPQMEPPAASAAILMHEAGKRAPARARDDRQEGGVLAWLTGLFGSFLAHPALAAAASLILVVTVAGSLYLRGKSQYAEPIFERASRPSGEAVAADEAYPGAMARPAEATFADNEARDDNDQEAELPDQQAIARDRYRAQAVAPADGDSLGQELAAADKTTVPVDMPRRELALKELKDLDDAAPRKGQDTARRDLVTRTTPEPAPARPSKRATTSSTSSLATTETRSADMMEADEGAAYEGLVSQKSEAAKKAKQSASPLASTQPASRAPQGGAAATPQAPPPAAMAEPQAAQRSEPTYRPGSTGKDDEAELAWARARHRSLLEAIGKKQCRDAARIAVDILDRNPGYYHGNVERSRELQSCQQYVAEERRARARRSGSKSNAVQADQAAPADTRK